MFDMPDEKTIVIGIVDGLADTDFPTTELKTADFVHFAAGVNAFILGHVFVFTIAARGGNHVAPRF
jgi:hypothetical protein